MRDRITSEDPFSVRCIPDQYKTQQMCDKAVDDCLAPLKFVSDWFQNGYFYTDLNNANLDDSNYDADDPDTITRVRLLVWYIKFENCKALKKELNKELMPIATHPKKWWNFCKSEDEEKEIEPMGNAFNV